MMLLIRDTVEHDGLTFQVKVVKEGVFVDPKTGNKYRKANGKGVPVGLNRTPLRFVETTGYVALLRPRFSAAASSWPVNAGTPRFNAIEPLEELKPTIVPFITATVKKKKEPDPEDVADRVVEKMVETYENAPRPDDYKAQSRAN